MDQKQLREWESKCIQENSPECNAACPLHVDARSFVDSIGKGNWEEALKVLRRTMPFPGLLGRICDHPCQARCLRGQVGQPIQIGLLERYCVSLQAPAQKILPLPAKDRAAAVIGGGLSGLTVAWDLSRKGIRVAIFEGSSRLGDNLLRSYPDILSGEILDEELSVLRKLNVSINLNQELDGPGLAEKCLADFDAVYLSLETTSARNWPLDLNDDGSLVPVSPMQTTSQEKVFAGGSGDSIVGRVAQGRWAATSMDRFMQKVSMTAGREKDGPYETGLFTSLEDVPALPAVRPSQPGGWYTRDEALAEAARCLKCECLECVKVCPYLKRFGAYPKKYAREIYNNASIIAGTRLANKLINSCSLCGLCEVVCPNSLAMQDLCLESRRDMVRQEKMPPSAHEFALLDMAFSDGPHFALARHQPGFETSAQVFFPGCQISASGPDQVDRTFQYLQNNLSGGVGLWLGCCGAPAFWSGREAAFDEKRAEFRDRWLAWGRPKIIAACSTCYKMFKDHLPEMDTVFLWQIMDEAGLPPNTWRPESPVAVHDPCTTRGQEDIQDLVRRILDKLNIDYRELKLGREKTECCGFGGLMRSANQAVAREVVLKRSGESDLDYLAYCAMCRDNLAGVGKRTVHLLDLFFPPEKGTDPAARARPGWSERQENRARLKERLLREIWREDFALMEEHQNIKLIIAPHIEQRLDERRILRDDIQKVIHQAEKTGQRFRHPETGIYKASFKPYKVTFWVEYTPREDAFEIHNAYAHRMEVLKGSNHE